MYNLTTIEGQGIYGKQAIVPSCLLYRDDHYCDIMKDKNNLLAVEDRKHFILRYCSKQFCRLFLFFRSFFSVTISLLIFLLKIKGNRFIQAA